MAAAAWWFQRGPIRARIIPARVSAPQPDLSSTLQASSAPVVTPVAVSVAPVVTPVVAPTVSSAPPHVILADDREWHGSASDIQEPRHVVIRGRALWQSLWRDMGRQDELPRINFNDHWVVGLFLGPKSGSGFEVQLQAPRETENETIVPYRVVEPLPGVPLSNDTVYPWQLRVIARTNKQIRFVQESLSGSAVSH